MSNPEPSAETSLTATAPPVRAVPAAPADRKPRPPRPVHYPESDGKPVAESDLHRTLLLGTVEALAWHFRSDPDIYVSGNMLLYYVEGDPRKCVAPDVFVVKGVIKRMRGNYRLWAEGQSPCLVIEFTSKSTRREDQHGKRALYARIGVREYFLFDPEGDYLRPRFQGYRLVDGDFEPMPFEPDGTLISQELDLTLFGEGAWFRMIDRRTGNPVLTSAERAEAEARRAEAEARRADAEAGRAEAETRRADAEAGRADAEAGRAEAEARRADSEVAARKSAESRAATAEAELARLRARLGQD